MSRKSKRPESPDPAIRANPFLAKSDAAQRRFLGPWRSAILDAVNGMKAGQLDVFLALIEQRADQTHGSPPAATGRPRNPQLDRAARIYLAKVEFKDKLRAKGFRGAHDDQRELHDVAKQCFPESERYGEREYKKLLDRIKYAVKDRRARQRAEIT